MDGNLARAWACFDHQAPGGMRTMTGYGRNRIEEERNIVMLKKLLLPVVLTLALAGYPAPSHAVCIKAGTIIGVFVDDADGSQLHEVRLRTNALSDHVWFAFTTDHDFINALIGFTMGQKQVRLTGDAASCPVSGASRFMGNLTNTIVTR